MRINIFRKSAPQKHRLDDVLRAIFILERTIMTKISEFNDAVQQSFANISAAVTGIQGDVTSLKDQVAALQEAVKDTITTEDKALLDGIVQQAAALALKVEALDGLTPPAAPPEE